MNEFFKIWPIISFASQFQLRTRKSPWYATVDWERSLLRIPIQDSYVKTLIKTSCSSQAKKDPTCLTILMITCSHGTICLALIVHMGVYNLLCILKLWNSDDAITAKISKMMDRQQQYVVWMSRGLNNINSYTKVEWAGVTWQIESNQLLNDLHMCAHFNPIPLMESNLSWCPNG